MKQLECN